jgi:hypothetical protein
MLEKFEKLANSTELSNLANLFPNAKEELFLLLVQPANFQRLVANAENLCNLAYTFRNHDKEKLLQLLIQPATFQRLVTTASELVKLAYAFHNHDKEKLLQLLIQPATFQRLVTTASELAELANIFSNYDLLKKTNIKEIFQELKANSREQKAYTRGAAMGFFMNSPLPPEIAYLIGGYLTAIEGTKLAQTNKNAAAQARYEYEDSLLKSM